MLLSELVIAVGLTLGYFAGFLALLNMVFPVGEDLRTLLSNSRLGTGADEAVTGGTPVAGENAPSVSGVIATLTVLRPEVKSRLAGGIAWNPARSGFDLHDRDGIQTGSEGRALVEFDAASLLKLERNSLVIISAPGGSRGDQPQRVRGLVVQEGELWARLRAGDVAPLALELPNAVASFAGSPGGGGTEFRVAVRRDRSATIAVLDGGLDVTANGQRVRVGRHQFSRVGANGTVSAPQALPGAPVVEGPADGTAFPYLDLPPRVTFRWNSAEAMAGYRVRVARDPQFRNIVVDESVEQKGLTWGRLGPGTYYWQVTSVADDLESPPSPTWALVVRREEGPPKLVVEPPPASIRGLKCAVRGSVDRRATVYVMGHPATIHRDGSFEIEFDLQPGANVVLVEAVDAAGHSTYWSRVVQVKP